MTSKSNQRAISPFKDPPKSLPMERVTAATTDRGAPTLLPTSTLSACNPNLKHLPHPQPSLRSKRSLNSNTLEEDDKSQPLAKKPAFAPTATATATTRPLLPPTDGNGKPIISDAVATIINIIPAAAAAAATTPGRMQPLNLDLTTTHDKDDGNDGYISPIKTTTTTRSGRRATQIMTSSTKKDRGSSRPILSSDPPHSSSTAAANKNATKITAEKHNNNNNNNNTIIKTKLKHPTKSNKATSAESDGTFSSKYRGVTRHRVTGRYEAHFWDSSYVKPAGAPPPKKGKKARGGGRGGGGGGGRARGRQVYIGAYANEESAAKAYDRTALAYLGPTIAPTNFPVENYEVHLEKIKGKDPQDVVTELRIGSMGFSRGKSLFKGVVHHHQDNGSGDTWEARLGLGLSKEEEEEVVEEGQMVYVTVGTFDIVEEAAVAYDRANVKYRGSKAVTNFGLSNYLDILENPDDAYLSDMVPSYTTLGYIPDDNDEECICDAGGVQLGKEALQMMMMRKKHNGSVGGGGRKSVRKSRAKVTTTLKHDDDDAHDDANDASADAIATDSKQQQQQQQQQGEATWNICGHALPEKFIAELLNFTSHLPTIQEPFNRHLPTTTNNNTNNNNTSNNNKHITIPVEYGSQGNLVLTNPLVLPGIGMITDLGVLISLVQQQQQNGGSMEGPALWKNYVLGNHHQPAAGGLSSLPGLNIMNTTTNVPATLPPLPRFGMVGTSQQQQQQHQSLGAVFNDPLSIANILGMITNNNNNNNSTGAPLVKRIPIRITNPPPPPPVRPIPSATNHDHDISRLTPIEKTRVDLQSAIQQQQQQQHCKNNTTPTINIGGGTVSPLPSLSLLANNNTHNRTFNMDASGNPYSTGWLDKLDLSTLNNNNNASIPEVRDLNQGYSPGNFNSGGKLGGGRRPWAIDYCVGEGGGAGGGQNVQRSHQQQE